MICTNCYKADYVITKVPLRLARRAVQVEGSTCPICHAVTFTQTQSAAIDRKRKAFDHGDQPLLTPQQLKDFRKHLDLTLVEICQALHLGKNTYGRWERGESAISASMSLLIRGLMNYIN